MSKSICRDINTLHPILREVHKKVLCDVINLYNLPFKLFETGRSAERHKKRVNLGKSKSLTSNHFYNLSSDPLLYSTAMDYVYYAGHWSWNLRDIRIKRFWQLFGELVIDCSYDLYKKPIIDWGGHWRGHIEYDHFELKSGIIKEFQSKC